MGESPFLPTPSPLKGNEVVAARSWIAGEDDVSARVYTVGLTHIHNKYFSQQPGTLYMDLPQKNLPQHTVTRGGRTYAIVEALSLHLMDAYIIVCSDEYYADEVSGPYLTYEEALADLESAADRFEMINGRPV